MQRIEIQNVIEEVTRRVIALSDSHCDKASVVATDSKDGGIEQIDDKVVSTQQLDGLTRGLKAIRVDTKALITPAAADWLREQNIDVLRVERQAVGENQDSDNERGRLVQIAVGSFKSPALTEEFESYDCIVKAARRCAEVITNGDRIVLFTDAVPLALISLNRDKKIRAIEVKNISGLRKDADGCFANIFVVNRQSPQSIRLIKQIQLIPCPSGLPPEWL